MPLIPSFTASQTLGNGAIINFMDTSTGSDVSVVARNIYLVTAQGTWLVTPLGTTPSSTSSFIVWPLNTNPFPLSILSTDQSLQITVVWVDINGNPLYTVSQLFCFTNYSETFLYQLTQNQAAQPSLLLDTNYLANKFLVRVYIDSANNAVQYGSDIAASQNCLNLASFLITKQQYFF